MQLSRYNLQNINSPKIAVPSEALFELPEKILQFGTGALLRGLPDYFVDKANRLGLFNGRIVVVKSTNKGDTNTFQEQDGSYTLCIRGFDNGEKVEENIICSAISRVLAAATEWPEVLKCAHNPQMQIIISNTTEVGIQLVNEDIQKEPPVSFPAKLLAFLLERYTAFKGSAESGIVIVPTELIDKNAKKLESIILELAQLNRLDEKFIEWLKNCNHFCNSLVDRIVPGEDKNVSVEMEKEAGFHDGLMIVSEVYRLWAIEGDETVAGALSFAGADEGVIITGNIEPYKELKLRLLNGTHTLSCGLAFLSGIDTVKDAMDDKVMSQFIADVMLKEIAPAIPYDVSFADAEKFGHKVLERFRNPFIRHQWINITLNYTQKMKVRVTPVLLKYFERFGIIPPNFVIGFAAYLLFMKPVKEDAGKYYGMMRGKEYLINDEKASYYFELWKNHEAETIVNKVLHDINTWDTDLTKLTGFEEKVTEKLRLLMSGINAKQIV